MQDNTTRGKRTLFWMKTTFVLLILSGIVLGFNESAFFAGQNPSVPGDPDFKAFGRAVLLLFVVIALGISACIDGLSFLLWLFRATGNMRTFSKTVFSPWGAVLCSCIPYAGSLFLFIVFRDLTNRQERLLEAERVSFAPVSRKSIIAWFALALACSLVSFLSDDVPVFGLGILVGIAGLFFFIRVFSAYIAEERSLFQAVKDRELREKVEQVIREREQEKACQEAASSEPPADIRP